ncbi:MAG TPA: hypothetical protein ENN05_05980 [Deltaproteobacteria bacterium]|nr:hypothetical protein [Deltaproteobacteria bacterium]
MEIYVDKQGIDHIQCDLLGLWHFSDERPLKGLTGLVDWRLDAMISRLIISGKIQGFWGEKVLLGAMDALVGKELLIIGLGPTNEFEQSRIQDAGRLMARTALNLNLCSVCFALPASRRGLDTVAIAEHLLYGLVSEAGNTEFTPWIMCTPDEIDEAILGFQKTKITLKSSVETDIIQVKS